MNSCGPRRPHGSTWYEPIGTDSESLSCRRGFEGEVVQTFEVEARMRCNNGKVAKVGGDLRKGRTLSERDYCRPLPRDCQGIAHGRRGFVPREKEEVLACPRGFEGEIVKIYSVDVEMSCNDGRLSETGRVETRGVKSTEDFCREIPKLSCGEYQHGANWIAAVGEEEDVLSCPAGQVGELVLTYQTEQEFECVDGQERALGLAARGQLVRESDTCRDKPKKGCGSKGHGQTWSEVTGTVEEVAQCKENDKAVTDLYESLESFKCVDGDVVRTGSKSRGDFIKTVGSCELTADEVQNQNRELELEKIRIAKEEASAICEGMAREKTQGSCLGIVSAAKAMSLEAVNVCRVFKYDYEKLYCLRKISDQRVYPIEAELCSNMKGFWIFENLFKLACIKTIERPFSESPMNPELEYEAEVEACKSEEKDSGKILCLEKLFKK